ncbi:SGNH/GDSL hydrolase family protein [Terrisporobacter muris]|uniref:GDSL-type esterase/lipase family protein n=1 Tax=Terrisporobacter muris TaxID=2963284 RepID=A0A9X2RZR9_9FIRM|nr:SGNH/GDSL hydrolase family protein [Terrisporobacter muris]MCR1821308.1 GDSL-type esterase/lipase family protein [Terrisporobacter muris]
MSILDKKHILTIDLDDSSIEYSKKIFFYNTDKNISNLYVKIKKNNDDGVGVELSVNDLKDITVKLTAIKPKTNQTREMIGILTEELTDQSCAIYKFELLQEFTDQVGSVVCEFELSNASGEKVTIDAFSYRIKESKLTGLNAEIESNPDLPVLKQLIKEVKETAQTVNNIDDVNITETKTFSNKKIDEKFSTVSSQIKDKANKDEVVKKGYANLNDFDEESRLAIAGGDFNLNYVLGEDNVKTKNIADNQVTPNKTNFINIEIGVNKFNKYNATIGGYLNGSGVVVGESDLTYGYSEKIAVNGGDIIRFDRYSALVSFPGVYYVGEVAYNINTISDLTYSNEYWCCTLPSNANFVRINIKSSYIDTQMLTINQEMPLSYVPFSKTQTIDDSIKIPNSYEIRIESLENKSNANSNDSNILYNKKWAVCGDSISYGARADLDDSGIRKTYDYYIAKRNNMTIVKNAISGSTITNVSGKNSFSVDRYKNLGSDLDYITLWFGINDSGVGSSILGTISDSDNTTFYGAWNVVLDYLIRTYPTAKIGIVVTYGGSETFRNATRDIAKKWGIPIFDIMGDFSIPLFAGRESDVQTAISTFRKEQFLSDGIHPNDVGYQYLSTSFESWLRSL